MVRTKSSIHSEIQKHGKHSGTTIDYNLKLGLAAMRIRGTRRVHDYIQSNTKNVDVHTLGTGRSKNLRSGGDEGGGSASRRARAQGRIACKNGSGGGGGCNGTKGGASTSIASDNEGVAA